MKNITSEKVLALYNTKNYPVDDKINIFGIRSAENESNKFNDVVGILYKEGNSWVCKAYKATTDPGLYYRLNPVNVKGTAILKEGYYKDSHKLGYHKGKYLALVQNKPITLYRDNDKDSELDREGKEYSEIAGINIHHASFTGTSTNVDKWSAGCQVLADISDWNEFIDIAKARGEVFSYALFNEKDLA